MLAVASRVNHAGRIGALVAAVRQLQTGRTSIELPLGVDDDLGVLEAEVRSLAHCLERQALETGYFDAIAAHINAGLMLEDVLDRLFVSLRSFIPFDRLALALIEEGGALRARWARTNYAGLKIEAGYAARLENSSLAPLLQSDQPRILNDLVEYLAAKPQSESTRLAVEEGIRSSLTCPLVANGTAIGFLFFSSRKPRTYADAHVQTYLRLARQLAVIVEKSRLASEMALQKDLLAKQNEQLRQLNETKDHFLGMVAHDLRNPIGNIHLIAEMLLSADKPMPPEDQPGLIKDILDQAEYMLPLLHDLIDVTRMEFARLTLTKIDLPLRDFLTEAVARHRQLAQPKGTQVLASELPEGEISADPVRLRQILDNLVGNAVKFSPRGSVVSVAARREAGWWRFEVQDQGPGLKESDRERIFQDFAKLSAKPTGGEKSTGLGLAITRRLIQAHGGVIGVESLPGQGATFWFTLPA